MAFTEDITRFTREGRDLDEDVWKVTLFVWDTTELDWVRMTQPIIDATDSELYLKVDDLEQYILDQMEQYNLSDWDDSGDPEYYGFLDKSGNFIIVEINETDSTVRYYSGSSNYSTAWTNRISQSYDDFATEF